MIGLSLLVAALFSVAFCQTDSFCPSFMMKQKACTCFSYVDGAVIKCSGPEGPGVIEQLKSVRNEIKELRIENANIIEIGPRAFRNLRVKNLILDYNRIRAIHSDAFRGLEDILLSLSIGHNKLTEIPTDALVGLRYLRVLNLKCNNIGDIYGSVFFNVSQLIELNLGCNQICKISGPAFGEVKETLQSLILDQNCLQEIPAEALRNFKTLLALHLQYNQIEDIKQLQLMNLVSLVMIRLTGNKIRSVDKYGLTNVPKLRYLYLDQNELTSIQPNVLQQFKYLEIIDLSYNNIAEIPGDSFKGLEHLMQLNLEGNTIKDIAPGAFAETPLLLLLLSHNCLTSVNMQMFMGIPLLRQLTLANNNIRLIQPLSFSHLGILHLLDLSHNKIQVVQPGSLQASAHATVVLRENPLVCTQQGFHIMQAGQLIHLLNEPNVVCKSDNSETHNDTCPTRKEIPAAETCCKPYQAVEKIELATLAPSSNPKRLFRPTQVPNSGVRNLVTFTTESNSGVRNLYTSTLSTNNENDVQESVNEAPSESSDSNSGNKVRRINMKRFWRLSQQRNTRIAQAAASANSQTHRDRFILPENITTTGTSEEIEEVKSAGTTVSQESHMGNPQDVVRPKLGYPPAQPQFPPRKVVPSAFPISPAGQFQKNSGLLIGQTPHIVPNLPQGIVLGEQLPPWIITSKENKSHVAVSFQEDTENGIQSETGEETARIQARAKRQASSAQSNWL